MHAVIRLGQDGVVSTFHKSFVDFLITPRRAPENQLISLSADPHDLASRCVEIMRSNLYFNMFQCEILYLPNSKQQLVLNAHVITGHIIRALLMTISKSRIVSCFLRRFACGI